jgi:hypothetical protein
MIPMPDSSWDAFWWVLGAPLILGIAATLWAGPRRRRLGATAGAVGFLLVVVYVVAALWAASPTVQWQTAGRHGRVTCNFDALASAFPERVGDATDRSCMRHGRVRVFGGIALWSVSLTGAIYLVRRRPRGPEAHKSGRLETSNH